MMHFGYTHCGTILDDSSTEKLDMKSTLYYKAEDGLRVKCSDTCQHGIKLVLTLIKPDLTQTEVYTVTLDCG